MVPLSQISLSRLPTLTRRFGSSITILAVLEGSVASMSTKAPIKPLQVFRYFSFFSWTGMATLLHSPAECDTSEWNRQNFQFFYSLSNSDINAGKTNPLLVCHTGRAVGWISCCPPSPCPFGTLNSFVMRVCYSFFHIFKTF